MDVIGRLVVLGVTEFTLLQWKRWKWGVMLPRALSGPWMLSDLLLAMERWSPRSSVSCEWMESLLFLVDCVAWRKSSFCSMLVLDRAKLERTSGRR
jgi:hypothetical protein